KLNRLYTPGEAGPLQDQILNKPTKPAGTRIRRASQIDWSRRPRRAPRARAPKSYRSKKMSKVRLTSNQYGKAEHRLMRVYRDSQRHEIRALNVTSQLW